MKSYFKLPNFIFDMGLKSNELLVYAYFTSICNSNGTAMVKLNTIAKKLGYKDRKAIANTISHLIEKGLLTKKRTIYRGKRSINKYHVLVYPTTKQYFIVERHFWVKTRFLSKSESCIYLYILRCQNSKKEAFPSLSKIQKELRMGRSTVSKSLKQLHQLKLIKKRHQLKNDRSFGHNLYTILTWHTFVKRVKKEQRTRLPQRDQCHQSSYLQYMPIRFFCQGCFSYIFFIEGGSLKKVPLSTTHFISSKKRE